MQGKFCEANGNRVIFAEENDYQVPQSERSRKRQYDERLLFETVPEEKRGANQLGPTEHMPAKLYTATTIGLTVHEVTVEVDLTPGLHSFSIVGLPDKAIEEAKDRVNAAIKNTGALQPKQHNRKIIVNLAPGELKKQGPGYDLPIALGFMIASEQIAAPGLGDFLFSGELALDGGLRAIHGILPIARFAKKTGKTLVIPADNAAEARLVRGVKFFAAPSLQEIVSWLERGTQARTAVGEGVPSFISGEDWDFDLAAIRGQHHAKRGLQISAAGGHNLLFHGPPGSGKTLLARAMPSILPPLTEEEMLEITSIWSIAGLLSKERPLVTTRPFRSPHHTSSSPAIIGGGANLRPGEVSLAHRGVLFIDELPELARNVLEALREPLENGAITIARATGSIRYPARFMFLAAQNPCPCGHHGDPQKVCVCAPSQVIKYRRKVSGPIRDRIDLTVSVPRLSTNELLADKRGEEDSATARERVVAARERQQRRLAEFGLLTNAEIPAKYVEQICALPVEGKRLIEQAVERFSLSPRGYHRVLKVARTIADLASSEHILPDHVSEALQYRHEQTLESY